MLRVIRSLIDFVKLFKLELFLFCMFEKVEEVMIRSAEEGRVPDVQGVLGFLRRYLPLQISSDRRALVNSWVGDLGHEERGRDAQSILEDIDVCEHFLRKYEENSHDSERMIKLAEHNSWRLEINPTY